MPLTLLFSLLYFVPHCFVSFLAYYFLLMFVWGHFEMPLTLHPYRYSTCRSTSYLRDNVLHSFHCLKKKAMLIALVSFLVLYRHPSALIWSHEQYLWPCRHFIASPDLCCCYCPFGVVVEVTVLLKVVVVLVIDVLLFLKVIDVLVIVDVVAGAVRV